MEFKLHTKTYYWTRHVSEKMKYYALSEQRVRRVIRNPERSEAGVVPDTVAVMQPIQKNGKTTQEIWAMYQDKGDERIVITAWRYPGKSPIRGQVPIPEDIQSELQNVLNSLQNKEGSEIGAQPPISIEAAAQRNFS